MRRIIAIALLCPGFIGFFSCTGSGFGFGIFDNEDTDRYRKEIVGTWKRDFRRHGQQKEEITFSKNGGVSSDNTLYGKLVGFYTIKLKDLTITIEEEKFGSSFTVNDNYRISFENDYETLVLEGKATGSSTLEYKRK
ncbi:MAG: hypothetical protein ACLFQK_07920 [Fibrobacterota bacterium]